MAVSLVSTGVTFPDSSTQITAATGFGFKNRIINGAMVIDQRNAGASVTPTTSIYTLDRWSAIVNVSSKFSVQQNAGGLSGVNLPAGFLNYLGVTSLSAYSIGSSDNLSLLQAIEGFNTADLGWGTANAQTVTLSFRVYSSLTGTFGGSISNSAFTYSYPFSYSIPVANTWTTISITIAGPTAGTWIGATNGIGMRVYFGLGVGSTLSGTAGAWVAAGYVSVTGATSVVGTSGATLYITGVQLEKGSTATSFDYRPYGTELALCQRYYFKTLGGATNSSPLGVGFSDTTTAAIVATYFPVEMRTDPTSVETSGTATEYRVRRAGSSTVCSVVPSFFSTTKNSAGTTFTVASGLTAGQGCFGGTVAANTGYLAWSAEL
jgi:hypothetical protein